MKKSIALKPTRLGTIPTRSRKRRRKHADVVAAARQNHVVALRKEYDRIGNVLVDLIARRAKVLAELASLGGKGELRLSRGELESMVLKIIERQPISSSELAVALGRVGPSREKKGGTKSSGGIFNALYSLEKKGRIRRVDPDSKFTKWEVVR